jgi:DNA polymerase-3 subunit epsilon
VRDAELIEEWSSLVNPECSISPYIEAFTGISNAMVAAAPRFADIAAQVRGKLQGAVFVAHNARFDYTFLRSEFGKADMSFSAKVLCTVKLSRRLFPEHARHNLDAVMERNGLTCDARHRALGDARVLHDFWRKLRRDVAAPRLAAAVHTVLGAHRLPAHLPPDLADDLPEGPGVYRFFGADESLLYVGRSHELRSRMCAQLAERRFEQVRRVDWCETAGELGAMLRESNWIRTQRPLRNRRAKSSVQYTLRAEPVGAVPIDSLDPQQLMHSFGLFQSAQDAHKALADIARARGLCLKVLGLETGEGSCLSHQLGKCKGACVGKEPLLIHGMRLQLALSSLKLKAWPFPGRIALLERSGAAGAAQFERNAELHVLDHWSYLGTARSEEELAVLADEDARAAFDADTYKILVRYFASHPKFEWRELRRPSPYHCASGGVQ